MRAQEQETRTEATVAVEIHHETPRCLLSLRDQADAAAFDGAGIQLWLDWEMEAMLHGIDPDIDRDDLAAMIEGSTVALPREDHRQSHAGDFARWGRRGGRATLRLYGTSWFGLLARRRWKKITAEALAEAFGAISGRRS